jgi:hypothetical protein
MSAGSLSRDMCDKCAEVTLHDHCICIHCGTALATLPMTESLGYKNWVRRLKEMGLQLRQRNIARGRKSPQTKEYLTF